jgi:DNA-binding SARP family transcriptional activator
VGTAQIGWGVVRGTEIDLGTPQQRAIHGVLLLHNGAVASMDRLISAIWGETPPPAAHGMVRSYISRLRRVLRDGSSI